MKDISKYSDQELCQLLSSDKINSERAFAEIYSKNSQRLFHYCLRIIKSPEDAKDIYQDTFLRFFKIACENPKIENINRLLIRIARNLCINYKRDLRDDSSIEDFIFKADNATLENIELTKMIATAIDLLEIEYKEPFILRVQHGLGYKEISEITNESISTLKSRVWRAKQKLKAILDPYLEGTF